nr:hypothetical protein [Schaalia sp. JY-X159]
MQHPGDVLAGLGGDLDGCVVLLDEAFDIFDQHGLAGAVGVPAVPAGADEVGVDLAVSVLCVADDEPGAALPAVDGSFEVVIVCLGLVGGRDVGLEDGLDLVPDLARNDRLMRTLVGHLFVGDVALVVRVRQHPVDARLAYRLRWPLRCRSGRQPAPDEFTM